VIAPAVAPAPGAIKMRKIRSEEVLFRRAENRRLYCQRCHIRYAAIPRYPGANHCAWCQEEIEAGHVIIGQGLEDAGGFLQVPRGEPKGKEYFYERKRTKRCWCGAKILADSKRCMKHRWTKAMRQKVRETSRAAYQERLAREKMMEEKINATDVIASE
jgi:hypothetical protein